MEEKNIIKYTMRSLIGLSTLILVGMIGCPQYKVYEQKLDGEAELAKANYSKQVAVQEAKAKEESATYLANARNSACKGSCLS